MGLVDSGAITEWDLQEMIQKYDPVVVVNKKRCVVLEEDELIDPILESSGPDKFDITRIGISLHPKQQAIDSVEIRVVFEWLKERQLLADCFCLLDLMAIMDRGEIFFKRFFLGKKLPAWKSVVYNNYSGRLRIPFLSEDSKSGELIIRFGQLYQDDCDDSFLTLLHLHKVRKTNGG